MNGHTVGFPMKYPSFTRQKKTAGLKVEKNDETVTLNCSPEEQRRKVNIQLLNLKMKAPNYQTAVRGNREETSANLNNFSSCNAWWSETSQKKPKSGVFASFHSSKRTSERRRRCSREQEEEAVSKY